jgi:hypothetical protein
MVDFREVFTELVEAGREAEPESEPEPARTQGAA